MDFKKFVLVPGKLRRGAFPHERAFVISFPDGSEYRGIVPASYCFTLEEISLGDAPAGNSEVDGLIAAILFARNPDGTSKVELPDGNVYELTDEQLIAPGAKNYVSLKP